MRDPERPEQIAERLVAESLAIACYGRLCSHCQEALRDAIAAAIHAERAQADADAATIAQLRQILEDAERDFFMAAERMARKTGNLELDTRRDGMREAYFDAAKRLESDRRRYTRDGAA